MALDRTGAIWVQDYPLPGDDSARYSIFDPDGRWLTRATVPGDWRILDIGEDYLLVLVRDDMDVEHVRRHRLTR